MTYEVIQRHCLFMYCVVLSHTPRPTLGYDQLSEIVRPNSTVHSLYSTTIVHSHINLFLRGPFHPEVHLILRLVKVDKPLLGNRNKLVQLPKQVHPAVGEARGDGIVLEIGLPTCWHSYGTVVVERFHIQDFPRDDVILEDYGVERGGREGAGSGTELERR